MISTGHCLCGAVQISVTNLAHDMHACHCENCRRQGMIGFSVPVPAADLTVTGDIATYTSSEWGQRAFCPTCGSNLWFRATGEEADYFLSPGLLDDLSGLKLVDEIFIDRKPAAYDFAGPTKRLTGDEFFAMIASSSEGGQP